MRSAVRRFLRRQAGAVGLVGSVTCHVVVASALVETNAMAPTPRRPELVAFEVPPPAPKAAVAPEPPRPAPMAGAATAPAGPAPPQHPPAPPAPAPPAPASPVPAAAPTGPLTLSGVTLSRGEGEWSTSLGDGTHMAGALGPIGARPPAPRAGDRRAEAKAASPTRAGARDVAVQDLSEKPRAPNLDASLRRLYPAAAREQLISGRATVRVRIGPAGTVTASRVVDESFAGFGAACQSALQASKWFIPRDRGGRAVATWIAYRCNFQLTR
jgi:TonB family protein